MFLLRKTRHSAQSGSKCALPLLIHQGGSTANQRIKLLTFVSVDMSSGGRQAVNSQCDFLFDLFFSFSFRNVF